MPKDPQFNRDAPAPSGMSEQVSPLVRRIIAPNPGPFTFTGTCSYIIGHGTVAILDPGPMIQQHAEALLRAVASEKVSHIVITHTHRDHSPAAAFIREKTGALLVGCHPEPLARPLRDGETDPLTTHCDANYRPDRVLAEGDTVTGPGWLLEAVATPGHIANHLAFRLNEENALFSGDHVMAWSTTVVSPPEGSMSAYMASLEKLLKRSEELYWPGHGGPVREPRNFVRALLLHRRAREAAILRHLRKGASPVTALVAALYPELNPALIPAAARSVMAHLEDMHERGLVGREGLDDNESVFQII